MLRRIGARQLVLGVCASAAGVLGVGAGPASALTLRGHAPDNTIVVRATGVASGTYTIDGGRRVRFSGIASLTIDGVGGHDVCRIVNPAGGLFAPPDGIACNGDNRRGAPRRGVLEVSGGRSSSSTYVPRRGHPGSGLITARLGRLVQVIRFSGLEPITDTVASAHYSFTDPASGDLLEVGDGPNAGQLTFESSTGQFESETIANKQQVTVDAGASGDSAVIDVDQPVTGLSSLAISALGQISVEEALLSGDALTLSSSDGDVVQSGGPVVLGKGVLSASAGGMVDLHGTVGGFSATAANGSVAFSQDGFGSLSVGTVTATQGVFIGDSGGGVDVAGVVSGGASSPVRVVAFGTVSTAGGGAVSGSTIQFEAPSMVFAGGSVNATGSVTLTPEYTGETVQLGSEVDGDLGLLAGDLAAITAGGGLVIGSADTGPIVVTEPITWTGAGGLTLLSAGGFTRDSAGTLSAPTLVLINGGSTARRWTITPASVADGSGFSIPYTAGTLAVAGGSGGDTFGVTPSPNTTDVLDGGPSANGILDYHPPGQTVSGSLSPPAGEIDAPGVKPVRFTAMAKVNGIPVVKRTPAPTCVLTAPSSTVSHPQSSHSGRRSTIPTTLALRVRCDQTASIRLTGTITELPSAHHATSQNVRIRSVGASVSANVTRSLTVTLPGTAATALAAGIPESASVTLTASNSNGTRTASLRVRRLRS